MAASWLGVPREAMLEAARQDGLLIREQPISNQANFEEFYLASTLKELAPVVSIDGSPVSGQAHRVAGCTSFRRLVQSERHL